MNCERFITWLENKDTHDVSEADQACKHAASCPACGPLLQKDEHLERCISHHLAAEPLPKGLKNRIDLSLDRTDTRKSPRKMVVGGMLLCCLLAALFFVIPGNHYPALEQLGGYAVADHLDHSFQESYFNPVDDESQWMTQHIGEPVQSLQPLPPGSVIRGARPCYLGDCLAMHVIYESNGKIISIFIIAPDQVDFSLKHGEIYTVKSDNNSIKFWRQKEHVYAMVI